MTKLRLHRLASRLGCAAIVVLAGVAATNAAGCPRPNALGTSRVLAVDATTYPRVGLNNFPETLPLADHEIVLTFDDGPRPPNTEKVLAALAHECARATFFLVGRSAAEFPALVRRIAAQGHTIAHHSWSHPMMSKIPFEQAKEAIDRGIAAVEMTLNGVSTKTPSTPFFRFPYFDATPATLDLLQSRGIVVFGADVWASDWENVTPEQELKNVIERLEAARKGIILLHDAQPRTAAMMPAFLRYLHENGYRVVHLVPAISAQKNAEVPH
ncbi:polysaccharide deacetylase [Bradyrhizobium sp. CCBAU 11386]|uniref:polysaccharide deacetylase family protein n=1 Tax=Bradyrhizobium sp. CCBAU 11386 TaxID=1630837 RepID=UPI002304C2F9|nr:polysaccharide deacetylase family protein [Bradyrhizobium sp. CCBAU 11386]MDA9505828.1 polysaccharide deacetylase [Bradyrhizobium sp. CCBAU 11386]